MLCFQVCGFSEEVMQAMRVGTPASISGFEFHSVGLLLICDGFDELQAGISTSTVLVKNVLSMLCGGEQVHQQWKLLRVVVTCRESRLNGRSNENALFGTHRRRLILPFNNHQVVEALHHDRDVCTSKLEYNYYITLLRNLLVNGCAHTTLKGFISIQLVPWSGDV